MDSLITELITNITNFMSSFGYISGFFIIILESILPVLPLGVFVALNIVAYGTVIGLIISWLATVIGCMIIFTICKKVQTKKLLNKFLSKKQVRNLRKRIGKISYTNLVIIMAVPFTPAFAINIAAGLSEINAKKYFSALVIGKLPMIYFWGYIGKSLIESITDLSVLAQILFMLILAFLVSKLVNKFLKL